MAIARGMNSTAGSCGKTIRRSDGDSPWISRPLNVKPMHDTSNPIALCPWSADWPVAFTRKASAIRQALGDHAVRIDHIGSTAIEVLTAKPIIDIQVSVVDLDQTSLLSECMIAAGYVWRSGNPDLTKRYFRERPGEERTHIHVRQLGSWHEQWPLLFRDYMRDQPGEHAPYVALKRALAARHGDDRDAYTEGKMDHLWGIIRRADRWAQQTGWRLGPSDA